MLYNSTANYAFARKSRLIYSMLQFPQAITRCQASSVIAPTVQISFSPGRLTMGKE